MAPINIPFFGSVGTVISDVPGGNRITEFVFVNTTINHAYAGKRVRIKVLQWIHRPGVGEAILMRLDFSSDFYSNNAGVISSINGSGTNTYNGVTYYQNNPGVGLMLTGVASNTVTSFFGTPTFEGMLLSPTMKLTIRPMTVDPSVNSIRYTTASGVASGGGVTNGGFGYAQLILDVEVIE